MSSAFSIKALDVHTWFYKEFETIAISWIPKQQIFRYVSEKRQLIILYGENFVTVWNSYRKILLEARRKIPCKLKLLIQL